MDEQQYLGEATMVGQTPFIGTDDLPDSPNSEIERCLRGEKLYGDDFSSAQIAAWLREEENAYFALTRTYGQHYTYSYHALNTEHLFRFLPQKHFRHALSVGGAYGEELRPLIKHIENVTILESSDDFRVAEIAGRPVTYRKPLANGKLQFADEMFDLVLCFMVLHHIPCVSKIILEITRCLVPGGFVLIREPIVSMGDWRSPRKGLTTCERGIPLQIFRNIIRLSGLVIVRESLCEFSLTSRLRYLLKGPVYNSAACTKLDAFVCRLPVWSSRYHARSLLQKLRPTAVSFVARRPTGSVNGQAPEPARES